MNEGDLLLARARSAWNAAKRDDDENMREASELRLARAWPKPRMAPARAFTFGAAAAFAVAAILFVVFGRSHAPQTAAIGAPAANTALPPSAAAALTAPPSAARVAVDFGAERKPSRVVATSGCKECRVEAGAIVDERVVVPAGSKLSLGFAFDDGLVDPASGVDLVGPASATSSADATVTIERGLVRVRAPRNVVVMVPGGKVTASNAVYTIRIDERGVARVDVEKGRVAVTKRDASEVVVPPGGATSFDLVGPTDRPAASGAPTTAGTTGPTTAEQVLSNAKEDAPKQGAMVAEEMLADARVRARQGDASGRAELEQLATSKDARVARRASFTLAELDLAAGAKDKARTRLDELVVGPESALGADAAMLLSRSYGAPADRAEVWRRYLATNPPSPYAERAQLERADALLDAGRPNDARNILDQVRRAPRLTDTQQKQLDRLTVKAR